MSGISWAEGIVPGYLCLGAGLVTEVKQGRSGPPHPNDEEPQARQGKTSSLPQPCLAWLPRSTRHCHTSGNGGCLMMVAVPAKPQDSGDSPEWAWPPHQGQSSTLFPAPPPTSGFPASFLPREPRVEPLPGAGVGHRPLWQLLP